MMQDAVENSRKLSVVFDIDDTLAMHESLQDEDNLYLIRKSMLLIAADRAHQVIPGAIELMQVLLSKPYINLAFFSSGVIERNTEFVEKLLKRSVGDEKYNQIKATIAIGSRTDVTPREDEREAEMHRFDINTANSRKDLAKVLRVGSSIKNAILVEDDSTYIYYGQEKNFLRCPSGAVDYQILKSHSPTSEYYELRKKKDLFRYNSIFYVAGILSDCIELFEKGEDVNDFLFNLHFKKNTCNFFSYEQNRESSQNEAFYDKGLALLKTVNPKISFVSYEDYMNTLQSPATEGEQEMIEATKAAKTNSECRIV